MTARPRIRLSREAKLALTALVLGAAAIAGDPYGGNTVTLDTRELAAIVEGEVDHVTPVDLADRIVRGDADYRLIDIRDAAAFAEYHIPTAENVPLGGLMDHGLARNEKIILYSGGGIHSAQAWFLLKARKYADVTTLLGGLDGWKDEVLFPVVTADAASGDREALERVVYLSRHFGGTPRTRRAEAEALAELDAGFAFDAPAAPALPKAQVPAVPPPAGKKKKEGC